MLVTLCGIDIFVLHLLCTEPRSILLFLYIRAIAWYPSGILIVTLPSSVMYSSGLVAILSSRDLNSLSCDGQLNACLH